MPHAARRTPVNNKFHADFRRDKRRTPVNNKSLAVHADLSAEFLTALKEIKNCILY
jgi:hypothetical protein